MGKVPGQVLLLMDTKSLKLQWAARIGSAITGKRIVEVRYMTDKEVEDLGWYSSAVVLVLDDGHMLFPSQDDEGNNAGSLFSTYENLNTFPVI